MLTYHETLETLFKLLAQANMADSADAAIWQRPQDAVHTFEPSSVCRQGHYGALENAIRTIAGPYILAQWAETGEIDYSLATRNDEPEFGKATY